ncbi:MAG: DUF294 nucleotidyltransferase-like domain-containing protein [Vibrio sp.]
MQAKSDMDSAPSRFLKRISVFDGLPFNILESIASELSEISLDTHATLAETAEESTLYFVKHGSLAQTYPSGALRAKLSTDDIFGFNLHQTHDGISYQVTALEPSSLYYIGYQALVNHLQTYPHVLQAFSTTHNQRLQAIQPKLASHNQYMKPCGEIAYTQILTLPDTSSIQHVAEKMRHHMQVSCAFILDSKQQLVGMITDKDMTKRVVSARADIDDPISSVMTKTIIHVQEDELVMQAVYLMMKHKIQHIPVLNNKQMVVGLITPQHLITNHSVQAIFLIDQIHRAQSMAQLHALSTQKNQTFVSLMQAHHETHIIGQILALIYDAFNQKMIEFALEQFGPPPCRFSWIVAGSHARQEVHLASDQDNALILEDSATPADRTYFQHFAMYVCKGLSELGYPLCSGRFMAATPKWCQKISVWKAYYKKWSQNPEYDLLLNLNVFVEIRHIFGDDSLFESLDNYRHQQISHNPQLTTALVRNALRTRPPLGIFKKLVLEKDGQNNQVLDIKKAAIACLTDLIRIYSLMHQQRALNTTERIEALYHDETFNQATYQDIKQTFAYSCLLRYQGQLRAIENGTPINNQLQPDLFSSFERQHIKDAFAIISDLQDLIKMKFGR